MSRPHNIHNIHSVTQQPRRCSTIFVCAIHTSSQLKYYSESTGNGDLT